MNKILLIEDDNILASEIADFLRENNFSITIAHSGKEAFRFLSEQSYDICLLDVGLPDCSGFDLCKKIRLQFFLPIIMVTAFDNEEDIILGLNCGADDYIIKPCSLRILLSRIASQLRRKNWFEKKEVLSLKSGELLIDLKHCMILKNNVCLPVGDIEFKLCAALAQSDGRIMPRDLLLDRIWDTNERFIENNTLSVHISRLRKKLGTFHNEAYIDTVKGIGYRWNFPVKKELL
ncbi:MAG: response regulator transcription factor [Schaedlerella sp.]|nr:response regulator transcription factor [Schaedlerella sp.]